MPVSFQLDSIPVLLVPAAMEARVRKRRGATDVCVLTDSLANTAKWVSAKFSSSFFKHFVHSAQINIFFRLVGKY